METRWKLNIQKETLVTAVTKSGILLINLALVDITTHLWGGTGRGEIALVIANISTIIMVSNVFCG